MSLKYLAFLVLSFLVIFFLINNFFLQVDSFFSRDNNQTNFLFYEIVVPEDNDNLNAEEQLNSSEGPLTEKKETIFLLHSFFGEGILLIIYFFVSLFFVFLYHNFLEKPFFDKINKELFHWKREDYQNEISKINDFCRNQNNQSEKKQIEDKMNRKTFYQSLLNMEKYYFENLDSEIFIFLQNRKKQFIVKIMIFLGYFVSEIYFLTGSFFKIGFRETIKRFQFLDLFAFYNCFYFHSYWFFLYAIYLYCSFLIINYCYITKFFSKTAFIRSVKTSEHYCTKEDASKIVTFQNEEFLSLNNSFEDKKNKVDSEKKA